MQSYADILRVNITLSPQAGQWRVCVDAVQAYNAQAESAWFWQSRANLNDFRGGEQFVGRKKTSSLWHTVKTSKITGIGKLYPEFMYMATLGILQKHTANLAISGNGTGQSHSITSVKRHWVLNG